MRRQTGGGAERKQRQSDQLQPAAHRVGRARFAQSLAEDYQCDQQNEDAGNRGVIALLNDEAQSDLMVSPPHRQQAEEQKSVGRRDRQMLQQSPERRARAAGPDQIEERAFNNNSDDGDTGVARERQPRHAQPASLPVLRGDLQIESQRQSISQAQKSRSDGVFSHPQTRRQPCPPGQMAAEPGAQVERQPKPDDFWCDTRCDHNNYGMWDAEWGMRSGDTELRRANSVFRIPHSAFKTVHSPKPAGRRFRRTSRRRWISN